MDLQGWPLLGQLSLKAIFVRFYLVQGRQVGGPWPLVVNFPADDLLACASSLISAIRKLVFRG